MNRLYYGDNLEILHNYLADESVDLIYIDPPFNSNQAYNVIFREADGASSQAQIQAFEDTWQWGEATEQAYHELVVTAPPRLVETIKNFRGFLTETNLMAYLVMMALRLVELNRVLKPTGSFYLHCDPTASHYLKIILDQVFGMKGFRNEIVWCYKRWPSKQKNFQKMHDVILRYSKSENVVWNQLYDDFTEQTKKRIKGGKKIEHYVGESGKIRIRATDEMSPGVAMCDYWNIPMIAGQAKERLGYPTQKPETLLERLINASSNEGDTVLDAFCGCGTTIAVAHRLKRQWIGIDITHLAIAIIKYRLRDAFGDDVTYEIIGEPKDEASARALAQQNRYQFQWWALSLIKARPYQGRKKGADEGIDGVIYFQDVDSHSRKEITQKIIVQVKSGHVSVRDIRELRGVVEKQKGVIGVLITLEPPTGPMITEAVTAGTFQRFQAKYPKIQLRTIQELLEGHGIESPQTNRDLTFKKAERHNPAGEQLELM
ncbi:restriction endonuclease [Candidatus Poribacteria bacterium]|nr:restriction endonuclease [Candidatus Poribacteria bacterium]